MISFIQANAPDGATHYDVAFGIYLNLDENNCGYKWQDEEWVELKHSFPKWGETICLL